jgi:hypothetical protein
VTGDEWVRDIFLLFDMPEGFVVYFEEVEAQDVMIKSEIRRINT